MTEYNGLELTEFFNITAKKPWIEPRKGAALALPDEYRQTRLKGKLYIEHILIENSDRNHVVFQLPFEDKLQVRLNVDETTQISTARVSMEMSEDNVDDIDKIYLKDMETDRNYYPGMLQVKLLTYDGKSFSAGKFSSFDLDFVTLGDFIDFVTDKDLHKMSFVCYDGICWEGCRDFVCVDLSYTQSHLQPDLIFRFSPSILPCLPCNSLQTFIQMRLANKVAEMDQDGGTLNNTITRVYQRNGTSYPSLISRAVFLSYNPVYPGEDVYEPDV
ncbi:hypothetical protein Clacol_003986 [Clathrus columnatus]|uniref:DUF4313 domain-containing protein n=1 Tax=Clathrus columnatus TaxID=1419009 RepID=A0AAV5A8D0_9AGAM|nr:hypothetical protein Clacol_003986 [Clathrus columnatus]